MHPLDELHALLEQFRAEVEALRAADQLTPADLERVEQAEAKLAEAQALFATIRPRVPPAP
jgi:type II secretory pathway component PulM